jgi:hypothetical protein
MTVIALVRPSVGQAKTVILASGWRAKAATSRSTSNARDATLGGIVQA